MTEQRRNKDGQKPERGDLLSGAGTSVVIKGELYSRWLGGKRGGKAAGRETF